MSVTGRWRSVALLCTLAAILLCVTQTHGGLTLSTRALDDAGADTPGVVSPPQSPAAQPDDMPPEHVPATLAALLSGLEGRAYYLLAEHVTCRANTPEHPRLKS